MVQRPNSDGAQVPAGALFHQSGRHPQLGASLVNWGESRRKTIPVLELARQCPRTTARLNPGRCTASSSTLKMVVGSGGVCVVGWVGATTVRLRNPFTNMAWDECTSRARGQSHRPGRIVRDLTIRCCDNRAPLRLAGFSQGCVQLLVRLVSGLFTSWPARTVIEHPLVEGLSCGHWAGPAWVNS